MQDGTNDFPEYDDPKVLPELLRRRVTREGPSTSGLMSALTSAEKPNTIDEDFPEEPGLKCPVPTPEDSSFFEREISDVITSTKKVWHRVCSYGHLPLWLQDNGYLRNRHRTPVPNFRTCINSIFSIHTETGNIWTHILGCLLFLGILISLIMKSEMGLVDKIMIGTFVTGATTCFSFSFVFHAVCCHSETICKAFNKLDYCGICVLITSSTVVWIYYGFYCNLTLRIIYTILALLVGSLAVTVSLGDKLTETKLRPLRTFVFTVYGLSGGVPIIHYMILEGFNKIVGMTMIMGSLYLTGGAIYVSLIPERFYPGRFDLWLHSHQIFHVLVVTAATVHYYTLIEFWSYRKTIGTCGE